jgi:hypothetical protein
MSGVFLSLTEPRAGGRNRDIGTLQILELEENTAVTDNTSDRTSRCHIFPIASSRRAAVHIP